MTASPRDLSQLEQHLNDRFAGPGLRIAVMLPTPEHDAQFAVHLLWQSGEPHTESFRFWAVAGLAGNLRPLVGQATEVVVGLERLDSWGHYWPFVPKGKRACPMPGYFGLDPWSQAELLVEAMLLRLKERHDDR